MAEINRQATGLFDGTSSAPALSFAQDTDVGLYRPSADTLGIVAPGQVNINNITVTQASGDTIGYQSNIRQGAGTTGSLFGGQIGPSVSNTFGVTGAVVGLHVAPYLRGTGAGTIGDFRVLNLELVTDDAGTRDVTGYVTAIRVRKVFSAGTVTGVQSVMRVEVPEAQTNSETYTQFFQLTGTITNVWHSTGSVSTAAGYIGLEVNGLSRWIQLYSTGP